jgi:WD40 repeat protein
MKLSWLSLVLIPTFILAGCTPPNPTIQLVRETQHPFNTMPAATASTTAPPTQTPITTTASIEPNTPTPVLPPSDLETFQYRKECIPIDTKFSPGTKFHGGLLLNRVPESPILMDLTTQRETNFPEAYGGFVSVSPDGKWVAYIRSGKELTLLVKSFSAQKTLEVPLGTNKYQRIGRWANNNEQVFIALDFTKTYLSPQILINPFTKSGVSIDIPASYPNQIIEDSVGTKLANVALDPSMNYAVYPAMQGDSFGLELFSINTNRQIAFLPSLLPPVSVVTPVWNKDGTKFIFNSTPLEDKDSSKQYTDELHIGGVDGSFQQLTRLSEQVTDYDVGLLTWSPNDRYVAFVVFDIYNIRLMFLDIQNKEILDVCIDSGEGGFQNPVWSPDGTQLAINKVIFNSPVQIILIDMPTMHGVTFSSQAGYAEDWVALEAKQP